MRRRTLLAATAGLGAVALVGDRTTRSTPTIPRRPAHIGFLNANAVTTLPTTQPFFDQLRELGYVEGTNVTIHRAFSDGDQRRLPDLVSSLLAVPVDVILASGGRAHAAATAVTRTVPLVLVVGPDPVAAGFVASPSRPGGNATAVDMNANAHSGKKLELLKELEPALRRVAVIYREDNTTITSALAALEAAPRLGLEAEMFPAGNVGDLDAVLARIAAGGFDAIMTTSILTVVRDDHGRLPEFAARHRMPACYGDVELVRAGGLMQLGPSWDEIYRAGALLVDRILKGTSPADLPVTVATRMVIAVNHSAAARIGVRFPSSILRQATEVVT